MTTPNEAQSWPPAFRQLAQGYCPVNLLARSNTSCVYVANDRIRHRLVAIKIVYGLANQLARGDAQEPGPRQPASAPASVMQRSHSGQFQIAGSLSTASPVERNSERPPLEHPGIIRCLDWGQLENAAEFYVFEFASGPTLTQLVRECGCLEAPLAAEILWQCTDAICHLHRAGWLHRDITPSNIVFQHADATPPELSLIDFGLSIPIPTALDLEDDSPGSDSATGRFELDVLASAANGVSSDVTAETVPPRRHRIIGTPTFLAPESVDNPPRYDASSETYALGCLGYFMLSGKPPLFGSTPIATCWKQLHETPLPLQPPPESGPTQALFHLVMQCLEKRPADRPHAADLLERLRHIRQTLSEF